MRDNVHQSRNKIGRFLGVLVGAALVATLGLPSAAQAQTPAAPTVTGTGDGTVGSDGTITAIVGAAAWYRFRPRSVAARIYRAWRRMGRCDGGGDPANRNYGCQILSPRMTHGSITASGDFACPTTRRTATIPIG